MKIIVFVLFIGLTCTISAVGGAQPDRATAPDTHTEYDKVVRPFLKQHCYACHGQDQAKGGLTLHDLKPSFDEDNSAEFWEPMLEQLRFDEMPPKKQARPDAKQSAEVIAWLEGAVHKSGRLEAYSAKLVLPEYGNYVSHEMLFSGEIKTPPYSPSRLWRQNQYTYLAQHRDRGLQSPFIFPTSDRGLRDFAAVSIVDQATLEVIINNINRRVDNEIFRALGGEEIKWGTRDGSKEKTVKVHPPNPKHWAYPFTGDRSPTDEQMRNLIVSEFRRATTRKPNEAEVDKYHGFMKKILGLGQSEDVLRNTLLAINLSAEAIYRLELGMGEADKHGRHRLSEQELAYALAYALSDVPPDRHPAMREALKNGDLETREGIQETVYALLEADTKPKAWNDPTKLTRIPRFFEEFFGYKKATAVFKDNQRQSQELPSRVGTNGELALVRDLDVLIRVIVREDKDVFRRLLTTDQFIVAHNGDNEKMQAELDLFLDFDNPKRGRAGRSGHERDKVEKTLAMGRTPFPGFYRGTYYIVAYGLPEDGGTTWYWDWPVKQPFKIAHRKGILTHPAWLWAFSTNFDNDPIHRGKWIRENLLAGVVQDVPPDVDAKLPENPQHTLRQRLAVTEAEACWRCHVKMNPLATPFEMFDDFGQYRTEHAFKKSDGTLYVRRDNEFEKLKEQGKLTFKPIDATGYLEGTGDPALDGPVIDAHDLMERLGKSDRVRQSIIRHLFRYFMGRNEMLTDSVTLMEADRAYLESGGSFRALVASLLSSDSFVYRK